MTVIAEKASGASHAIAGIYALTASIALAIYSCLSPVKTKPKKAKNMKTQNHKKNPRNQTQPRLTDAELIDSITDHLVQESWRSVVDDDTGRFGRDCHHVLWIPSSLEAMRSGEHGEIVKGCSASPQYFGTLDGSLPSRIAVWQGRGSDGGDLERYELTPAPRANAEFIVDLDNPEKRHVWLDGSAVSEEEQDLLDAGGGYVRRTDINDVDADIIRQQLREKIRQLVQDRINSLLEE